MGMVGNKSSSSIVNLFGSGVFLMWQARLAYLQVQAKDESISTSKLKMFYFLTDMLVR